eukprot:Gregarina_sp_Pseudo_9__610@NODE_1391_length_1639_cov_164_347500_g1297_i0_p1_GENE_NODE_1391_length_1639_cov_164_347500_g1297_i0NODE_1391_length_1639_cov_164_347500_g1297_i0_p1_ORF_typecomplete_len435_score109_97GST_N/PF02798_20/7_9e12GST_N/PF02798_20/1_2e06GST_C_3/PF14497_6/2_3e05GST_C_3/PF14497_6/4_6e10GST_N_3/PF13417_6/4_6e06GST_N_3/PF13417_6/0_13GST_C/PF00043_25/0_02GST_C/PF00043_25/0_039GST_N_4/PF17172_4/0_12GST_N_4/PF17172_4/19Tom37/PF10568_9/5Tom37/PF10568_9/9_2Cyclase/PF04199_13/0_09_NODE_
MSAPATTAESKPKLTYFNFRGKAQAIRWALRILDVDFDDNRVSFEWFKSEIAPKSPNGYVPLLQHNGVTYSDSLCILRLVCSQLGQTACLMPTTELDDLHAVAAFCLADAWVEKSLVIFRSVPQEQQEEAAVTAGKTEVVDMLKAVDSHIATHQDGLGHVVSHKLTYADLYVASQVLELLEQRVFTVDNIDAVAPHCMQTLRMVLAVPAVKSFDYESEFRNPVLNYFNLPNRAEAVRLCFKVGGVPFEDRLFVFEEWQKVTPKTTPTGQLPMLEFENKFLAVETISILEWVGERTGLTPVTWRGKQRASAIFSRFQPTTFLWRRIREAADPEAMKKEVVETLVPAELEIIERLIPATTPWIAGFDPTWIDLYMASQWKVLLNRAFISEEKDAATYPRFHKIYKQVYDLPAVKEYFDAVAGPN